MLNFAIFAIRLGLFIVTGLVETPSHYAMVKLNFLTEKNIFEYRLPTTFHPKLRISMPVITSAVKSFYEFVLEIRIEIIWIVTRTWPIHMQIIRMLLSSFELVSKIAWFIQSKIAANGDYPEMNPAMKGNCFQTIRNQTLLLIRWIQNEFLLEFMILVKNSRCVSGLSGSDGQSNSWDRPNY